MPFSVFIDLQLDQAFRNDPRTAHVNRAGDHEAVDDVESEKQAQREPERKVDRKIDRSRDQDRPLLLQKRMDGKLQPKKEQQKNDADFAKERDDFGVADNVEHAGPEQHPGKDIKRRKKTLVFSAIRAESPIAAKQIAT